MKAIKEIRDTQETLIHILNDMSDRVDVIRINSADILGRYVDEVNNLKAEIAEVSKGNPNYRIRGN